MKIKITHLYDHNKSETIDGDDKLIYNTLIKRFPIVERFGEHRLEEAINRINASQFIHVEVL